MTEKDQIDRLYRTVHEDDHITGLLTMILERQDTLIDKLGNFEKDLAGHMAREEGMLKALEGAFPKKPDGSSDFDGHREYHSSLIEESKSRAQMWRELRTEIVKKGAWGLVMVIGALIAYWWNNEVKK